MTTPEVIRSLIEKVEAGSGPSDVTEAMAIANDLSPWSPGGPEWDLLVQALRGSIDAAVALTEKMLPGWKIELSTESTAQAPYAAAHACVMDRDNPDPKAGDGVAEYGHAATLPRALLSALLHALLQRLENGGGDG